MTTAQAPTLQRSVDAALAVLAVLWTAEALGLLPVPPAAVTAVVYAGFCARLAASGSALVAAAARRWWWLLPFPGLCLLSALWSPVPQASATAAVQLGFTLCIALYLGIRFSPGALAMLACVGLGLALLASAVLLALGGDGAFAPGGGYQGVFLQKNGLGQRAALFLVLSALLLPRLRGGGAFALWAGIGLAVWMLVASRSVTSQLMAPATLALGAVGLIASRGGTPRALATVGAATAAAAVAVLATSLQIDPFALLLEQSGKAPDLSGRVVLWDVALTRGAEAPAVGLGYMAYWKAPAFVQDVAVLRLIYGPTVAAFHNFLLEAYVGLGLAGIAAVALMLLGVGLALHALPRGAERVWLSLTVLTAVALSLLGSSLHRPHEIVLLLIVAVAVAAGERSGAASERSP